MNDAARHWPVDDRWLQALPQPVLGLDASGTIVGCNAAAERMLGATADELTGHRFTDIALSAPDRGGFAEVLRLVAGGGQWTGELGVRRQDATGPTELHVVPAGRQGDVTGSVVVAERLTGSRDRAVRLSERLTRLARVTAELLSAEDQPAVTDIVVGHLADAAGATVSSLSVLVDDDTFALLGMRGGREGAASRWATFPLRDATPAGDAVRTGHTIVLVGRDQISRSYPQLEVAAEGERSMVVLPLVVAERALGAVSLSFPGRHDFDAAELEFLRIMADTCAQAMARIRAREDAEDQAAKLQFLAEASAELASSLDYESTLRNVAWLAVPRYADWCSIALEQDGVLRTLAVAHRDPAKIALAQLLEERYPPRTESSAQAVLRTGTSMLTPDVTDEMLAAIAVDAEHLELLRQLELRSGMVVPLKAGERVFGTVSWVSGEDGRRFRSADIEFGEDFARRAATAIDNALLHSELREVADRLQQAVVPPPLPRLPGWELAAVYAPSGRTDVGGDFYDVIPLDADRFAFFVGDVMGRGVQAAAAMAHISSALRTLVAVDADPEAVLTRLDILFERFGPEQLVTLVYGVAHAARNEMVLAAAGHPPPLLVRRPATASYVDEAAGLILGAGGAARRQATIEFAPGDLLVAYTDGLVERRGEDLGVGRERLLEATGPLTSYPLSEGLPKIVDAVRDHSREDDLAVLGLRRLRSEA